MQTFLNHHTHRVLSLKMLHVIVRSIFQPFFLILAFFLTSSTNIYGQTGPGGVGDTSGLSTLQLWLHSDACEMAGDTVHVWTDHSGADNHVYGSGLQAPTFENHGSRLGVEFKGNQFLQSTEAVPGFSPPVATVVVVYRGGRFRGTLTSIAERSWNDEFLIFNSSAFHHTITGNFVRQGHQCVNSISNDAITIATGVYGESTTDLQFYINGFASDQSFEIPGSPMDFKAVNRMITIGQRARYVPSEYLEGVIYEVIAYNKKLLDDEREAVENYLRCKYDITETACASFSDESCQECQTVADFSVSETQIPVNACITLENRSESECSASFTWTFAGSDITGSSDRNPGEVCFNTPGRHPITLEVSGNCGLDSLTKFINVIDNDCELAADFSLSRDTIEAGDCITFLNQSAGQEISSYTWDFMGPVNVGFEVEDPGEVCFPTPGTQVVALTVTSSCGSASVLKNILIVDSVAGDFDRAQCVFVPNAFTPNGDGQNDLFYPHFNPSCPITSIHLTIFDRWGGILYEEDDTTTEWNGYVDNRLLPPGTYIYLLDISYQEGATDRLSGNVMLVR